MEWLIQIPALLVAATSLWLSWRTQKRSEARDAATLVIAAKAQEIAERAEARAAAADDRGRVRFQYDGSEVVHGIYEGAVKIRLLHVGTETLDSAAVEDASLGHWEVHHRGHPFDIAPGMRIEITMRRNFHGELPEHLTVGWSIGAEDGDQVVALPSELSRRPETAP